MPRPQFTLRSLLVAMLVVATASFVGGYCLLVAHDAWTAQEGQDIPVSVLYLLRFGSLLCTATFFSLCAVGAVWMVRAMR